MTKGLALALSCFVLVANFLDAWLTLWWIKLGWATEQNPLLKELVERPVDFLVVKMLGVAVGVLVLWEHRKKTVAFVGLFLTALVYCYVLAHHLAGALVSLRG